MSKIEKEEMENELVRYKMLQVFFFFSVDIIPFLTPFNRSYAELAHAQQDALSVHSRLSSSSTTDTSKLTK